MDKRFDLLSKRLPKKLLSDKKELLSRLTTLNHIGNAVMHPAKGIQLRDEDFAFVREFHDDLKPLMGLPERVRKRKGVTLHEYLRSHRDLS